MFAMINIHKYIAACFFLAIMCNRLHAQSRASRNPVFVDSKGILRFTKDKTEAAFFGVNYTAPFAYAYRAHKALSVDIEKAIRQDVYHLARLGLDAFRVHVWDTEITDSLGNLLDNENLRLFDFLVAELKKRNIKTIVTPIAFWGNGYPERDERTPGFSRVFGKGRATVNDTAIRAQENYLQQFFQHVNPYTGQTYRDDPDIIAAEINNEPSHSGPKQGITAYINRLAAAIRSTGWTKPLYYNISQNPYYADAVAKANIDGVSFQWYPSGLVSNTEVKGNYLPHVDNYSIPYDTIPEYRNKTRMVYEFDAADILQSYMYPAMARSFREAGFQWATQFAYDPMALAYANTEYQTHYLNLAYTPNKAISLLIASEVFHQMPRLKDFGVYPADSVFGPFRVSYLERSSEMNTPAKFYYSNNTTTHPIDISALAAVAGVGSSTIVQYEGTGAYFLDKVAEGVWRLELMPDAIAVRDPFERASPSKEVTRIQWQAHSMQIKLPSLGEAFAVKALNDGNNYSATAAAGKFSIVPGTYLLTTAGKTVASVPAALGRLGMNEFAAPASFSSEIIVRHEPYKEVSAGKPVIITAKIAGVDTGTVTLQVNRGFMPVNIIMQSKTAGEYEAEIPANLVTPGILNYRIIIRKGNEFTLFPGNIKKNPFAWDNYQVETWETFVANSGGALVLFNPSVDRNVKVYPNFRRNFQSGYIAGEKTGQLVYRLSAGELSGDHTMGFQQFVGDKLQGRSSEIPSFDKIVVRARTINPGMLKVKFNLVDINGQAFSFPVNISEQFTDIIIPLNQLRPDSAMLLPRPYPGFQSLWFKGGNASPVFNLQDVEKIELSIGSDFPSSEFKKPYGMEVESIWLQKTK